MFAKFKAWIAARWAETSTQLGLIHITAGIALKSATAGLTVANSTPGHIGIVMAIIGAMQVIIPSADS